jgi:hypothetical protein
MSFPLGGSFLLLQALQRKRRMEEQDDGSDLRSGSGFGHRRPRLMGDVVSLGYTTLILFWIIVFTVLMGLMIGLYVG